MVTFSRLFFYQLVFLLLAPSHILAAEDKPQLPVRDRIVIRLHCTKAEAIERTVAAIVAEDLRVAKSEEGIITAVSIPVTLTEGMFKGMLIGTITYSGTVIGLSDTSSEVVVGATMTTPGTSEIRSISSDMSKYWSRQKDKARYGAMYAPFWQRVERIAGRLELTQKQQSRE